MTGVGVRAGIRRRSPVLLPIPPVRTELRDGWEVVLEYEGEAEGPWLVDLSHRVRWDLQDAEIGDRRPFGVPVPERWGDVSYSNGLLVNRMNRTQASIWHVGPDPAPEPPVGIEFTDTTDSHCWLAFLGPRVDRVLESMSSLDLFPPDAHGPRLIQGPILHVPAQIVAFPKGGALVAVARGYGQAFADAALHAARDVGLRPGGEAVYSRWLAE